MQLRAELKGALFLLLLLPLVAHAQTIHPEKVYQAAWCERNGGVIEYVLEDRTRVDCLTDEFAVEVDFARKWQEAIGQALYYGIMTNRKPGIVLIIEKEEDSRYLDRLKTVTERVHIRVWTIGAGNL